MTFAVGLALLVMAACATAGVPAASPTTTEAPTSPPCGDGASRVELGHPAPGGPTARFTTQGGPLYVAAGGFEHGGYFDPAPGNGRTVAYVGRDEQPPTYDEQRNIVTNKLVELPVRENRFTNFDLPPGRYWLWTSGVDVLVVSCSEGALTDPVPVTPGLG
ncbi:MAG: hypothetical protein ACR2GF_00100 [Acidimicrobiales bacterium]